MLLMIVFRLVKPGGSGNIGINLAVYLGLFTLFAFRSQPFLFLIMVEDFGCVL